MDPAITSLYQTQLIEGVGPADSQSLLLRGESRPRHLVIGRACQEGVWSGERCVLGRPERPWPRAKDWVERGSHAKHSGKQRWARAKSGAETELCFPFGASEPH